MKKLRKTVGNEPVLAGVTTLVGATIGLLVAFHVNVTPDQREAIEGWLVGVVALGTIVRSRVTPLYKVLQARKKLDADAKSVVPTTTEALEAEEAELAKLLERKRALERQQLAERTAKTAVEQALKIADMPGVTVAKLTSVPTQDDTSPIGP